MTIWNKYKLIKEINSKSNIKTYIARIEPMIKEITPKNKEQYHSIIQDLKILKNEIKIYDIIEENDKIYIVIDNDDKVSSKIDKLLPEENTLENSNIIIQENSSPKNEIINSIPENKKFDSSPENRAFSSEEIEKSICKIYKKENKKQESIGFFCKFEIDKFPIKFAFFTSYNILKQEETELGKIITFNYLNTEKTIKLVGDRKIYTNEDLNYNCIEIFNSDDIKNYFIIKPYEEKKNYSKEKDIFTIQYNNNDISFLPGKILSIDDKNIIHNAISENECYGSPIIRKCNNTIIGLNYGRDEKNYLNNLGTTFDSILNDISNGQYSGIKKDVINPNNENNYSYIDEINKEKKNEIYCIYNKTGKEINIMYDYRYNQDDYGERKKAFEELKNFMNAKNIEKLKYMISLKKMIKYT